MSTTYFTTGEWQHLKYRLRVSRRLFEFEHSEIADDFRVGGGVGGERNGPMGGRFSLYIQWGGRGRVVYLRKLDFKTISEISEHKENGFPELGTFFVTRH
ncbi:hypothetical protein JTE90_009022 [Oedothorax gibbosus]|uniref:Uncharacterized protein n=1 Tax=Oedothorax gibbosus TaxID=931172 RepID=A0AAV6VL84_9ARAC|nr:hypothetical protein JTE90_009022 [Oedothorax gibbosus]